MSNALVCCREDRDRLARLIRNYLRGCVSAFELDERGIPRQGYDIIDSNGKTIGNVTSGTMSPSLGKGIGMGYVPRVFAEIGSKINIQVRKNAIPATIIKLPFYKG